MRLDVSCVTHSRIVYKQLYSGSRNGKSSTQFLQVLCAWEILFSQPVERVIRFTNKVKNDIYIDASSVQDGLTGGCLIAASNGAQARRLGTRVPGDSFYKKCGRECSHYFIEDTGGSVRDGRIPKGNREFEGGTSQ